MTLAQTDLTLAPLLELCRRHAEAHIGPEAVAPTPLAGLTVVRVLQPGALLVAVQKPVVAMLLQGRKRVTTLEASFDYAAGEAMVVAADVPTVSQITRASAAAPYYALILELDPAILRELLAVVPEQLVAARAVATGRIAPEVAEAALRLARLFAEPEALSVLAPGLLREIHYWLLKGEHGPAIRQLGAVDSHADRIARAVRILRSDYGRKIRIEELAEAAGMSAAAFHRSFRAITTLPPLQFQKQLRLIEARRLMLASGAQIAQAADAVGYASVSQFTRDYGRLFGISPGRDMRHSS